MSRRINAHDRPRTRLDITCTAEEYATVRACAVATGRQLKELVMSGALAECRRIQRKIAASSKSTEADEKDRSDP